MIIVDINSFDELQDFLDNLFFKDEHSKEIIAKSGFTQSQISIINTLIINAIRAYDLKKNEQ